MKILCTLCIALLGTLAVSAVEAAGEKKEMETDSPYGMEVQASGKIVSLTSFAMEGYDDPHFVAKIKGEDGKLDLVDLGSAADLKQQGLELREGQKIFVTGRVASLNDQPILDAETISESKLVSVMRKASTANDKTAKKDGHTVADHKNMAANHNDDSCFHTVEGRILSTRTVKLESGSELLFTKIQTDSGIVVVNLGKKDALPKIDIADGQSIVAAGYVCHLNGKPFIMAHAAGNMVPIAVEKVTAVEPKP